MTRPLAIDYYTDILCVWAWIAQRRVDELHQKLGDKIEFHYYYVDVFGDVPAKIHAQWNERGDYQGFAEHVRHSASAFDNAPVNPSIWNEVRPNTSANAHLVLKAIEICYDKQTSVDAALLLRKAFFIDACDIGNLDVICELICSSGLDKTRINTSIHDGSAMAALMGNYKKAQQQSIKGSPSYVIDGGRQTLYGNVGYRVLLANIEELLRQPPDEASWC